VSDADVVRHLVHCDIVVIPSRPDSIPLVLTEAVQVNRPVIGSEVGDLGNMIRRYGLGVVAPSIEPSALAETMVRAARQPSLRPEGRTELLERFRPETAARTFLDAISEAANRNQSAQISPTPSHQRAYSE